MDDPPLQAHATKASDTYRLDRIATMSTKITLYCFALPIFAPLKRCLITNVLVARCIQRAACLLEFGSFGSEASSHFIG
jgi:hypothetical protein